MQKYLKPTLLIKYFVQAILLILGLLEVAASDWSGAFMAFQAFLFSLIPTLLKKFYNIRTPHILHAGVVIFMFATIFLGEVENFYERFWWWDLIFHTLAGIIFGLIGYIMLILTYRTQNVRLAPLFTSLFAISFSLGVSVIWEILEFVIDSILNTNMQPSASDTMWDLIVGLVGALISTLGGYRYLEYNERLGMSDIIDEGVRKNAS